jgi:hypothetical protein
VHKKPLTDYRGPVSTTRRPRTRKEKVDSLNVKPNHRLEIRHFIHSVFSGSKVLGGFGETHLPVPGSFVVRLS